MPDNVILIAGVVVAAIILLVVFRRLGEMRAPTPVRPRPSDAAGVVAACGDDSTRVAVTHPLIRRAAERALEQGGEVARHICREGATIYFSFDALPDPAQRRRAVEILRQVQGADASGADVDMTELMAFVRQLLGK